MACEYYINTAEELVTITGTEHVELAQAMAFGRTLLGDAQFKASLPQLIDLRGLIIRSSAEERSQFEEFVLQEYHLAVRSSVAIVVDDSLDRDSLAALYHLTSRVRKSELFDDYNLALKWLMRTEFAPKTTPNILRKSNSP